MAALDLKKEMKRFYEPSAKEVSLVDVPRMSFLMVDGSGDPNDSALYQAALEALYSASYTIKFVVKKRDAERDYTVPPLEGLWWSNDMGSFSMDAKDQWLWTMMMMVPQHVTAEEVAEGMAQAAAKKPPAQSVAIRFQPFHEGVSAQVMHIGPYAAEAPTIARLHAFIAEQGLVPNGKHHEIYLSDPRRTKPEKLRTVLRQPVALRQGRVWQGLVPTTA